MGAGAHPYRAALVGVVALGALLTHALASPPGGLAQSAPAAVLDLQYRPAARAQIAIWVEDADGRYLRTLRLTEAVAYRGIGNRPGASQMNSGYRWPYGRREGVLPVWASRRAAAPEARPFKRVIFQQRREGAASKAIDDESPDDYFCLSFDQQTTRREALDAVSCASVFTSDKGRFITAADVDDGYAEPYVEPDGQAVMAPLPLTSWYPPRMDAARCTTGACFDHADVDAFAAHVRTVMPDIDAITMATPKGGVSQSELFSVPADWPAGRYVVWLEINVEGDYNGTFNDSAYPTPTAPAGAWDSWAVGYGYPYRGQPSVVYRVPIELDETGAAVFATATPEGRSSWDVWSADYGELESMSGMSDDPTDAPGSGADRLAAADPEGNRFIVAVEMLDELDREPSDPEPPDDRDDDEPAPADGEPDGEAGPAGAGGDKMPDDGSGAPRIELDTESEVGAMIITDPDGTAVGGVGEIRALSLRHHQRTLRAHEWIRLSFRAPQSELGLHRYEVRVGTEAIVDGETFLTRGRPAKGATDDPEGAASLMLPTDVQPGEIVRGEIGDLVASTRYYVAIRGVDRANRPGPISVAEIATPARVFTTVSPCFVATVAYGTPLCPEVGRLRRVRDRWLMSHGPGRALVRAYYALGPSAAAWVAERPRVRAGVRRALAWLLDRLAP